MRMRQFWLTVLCLGVLTAVGLPSLSARGATMAVPQVSPMRGASNVVSPRIAVAGAMPAQGSVDVYLPMTNKNATPSLPTATATVTPTATATMTPTVTATPTSEPSPTPTAIAATIFVDDSNTTATQDGTTQHPYASLQAAIGVVKSAEVTIAVAAGVYVENIVIENQTVHLYGGFVGGAVADYAKGAGGDFSERDSKNNISHIQGDGTDSVVTLMDAGTSTLAGFRITDGARSTRPEFGARGGGLYIVGGAPTIADNLIENNSTDATPPDEGVGGGIYAENSDIAILNNIIQQNRSGRGGGIAISSGTVTIRGNTVQKNVGVSDHGGGLYIAADYAEIRQNMIRDNEVGRDFGYGWGGGIIVYGAGSSALLTFNTITENYAPSVGSGVFIDDGARATLDHELIYKNDCPDGGTTGGVGIYVDGYDEIGSYVTILHTTVADHDCVTQGGNGLYVEVHSGVTVQNSIFWGNGGDDFIVDGTSKITATYTLAEENITGVGNLHTDPLFADPAHDDYHLQSTTGRWNPAANAGSGAWVVDVKDSPALDHADPASDFAQEPAPNGGRANMGAYGNTAEASKSGP